MISGVQCVGNVASSLVTASNLVTAVQNPGAILSFSINNLNSPPTNQAADGILITTFTNSGASIDSCNAFVTGLVPQVIPSSQFLVG